MFCSNCGQKAGMGERFCSACGSTLEKAVLNKKGPSPQAVKIIALGVMVLIVVVGLVAFLPGKGAHPFLGGGQTSPENTLKNFMGAWNKQDIQTMAILCGESTDFFTTVQSIDDYYIGQVSQHYDRQAIAMVTLVYELLEPTGKSMGIVKPEYLIYTIEKDGKWFIDVSQMEIGLKMRLGISRFS